MPAAWTWLLCDAAGTPLAELSTAAGRKIVFQRNAYPEATFTISHQDDAAALLLQHLMGVGVSAGVPTLRCYRRADGETASTLRFNGYLAPFQENLAEDGAQLSAVFRGPFGRLVGDGSERGRFTAASRVFAATDAGQIAKTLISEANAAGATGVGTTGAVEATKTRDRTYPYANVGQAVTALTEVLDGFDFEVVPVESGATLGQFTVYAQQGIARPDVQFQYGPGTIANVSSVQRQIRAPVNFARVIGAGGLVGEKTDAASIAAYGLWPVQIALSNVSEQVTLDDKAQALLRPQPIRVVSFAPDPGLAPLPWDDYWLGDTVSFYGRDGAFSEDVDVRVNAITVVIDEDGNEAFEVPDPLNPDDDAAALRTGVEVETGAADSFESAPALSDVIGGIDERVQALET